LTRIVDYHNRLSINIKEVRRPTDPTDKDPWQRWTYGADYILSNYGSTLYPYLSTRMESPILDRDYSQCLGRIRLRHISS